MTKYFRKIPYIFFRMFLFPPLFGTVVVVVVVVVGPDIVLASDWLEEVDVADTF